MPRTPLAPLLLIGCLSLAPITPLPASEDCAVLERAHERLLESSFEVERTFRMSINGKLKKREVAKLTYTAGTLDTTVIEEEVLSKNLVLDSPGKDFALSTDFSCARLNRLGKNRYEVLSEDGLEVVTFERDDERAALVPKAWRLDTTERFLFKKFVIVGRAEYSEFKWR